MFVTQGVFQLPEDSGLAKILKKPVYQQCMIIQCPSCDTKFSIDGARIKDLSRPRFHCSRCDHFFDLEGRGRPEAPDETPRGLDPSSTAVPFNPPSSTTEEVANEIADPTPESDEPEQLPLFIGTPTPVITDQFDVDRSRPTLGADAQSPVATAPGSDPGQTPLGSTFAEEKFPLITAEWPESDGSRPHQVDLSHALFHGKGGAPNVPSRQGFLRRFAERRSATSEKPSTGADYVGAAAKVEDQERLTPEREHEEFSIPVEPMTRPAKSERRSLGLHRMLKIPRLKRSTLPSSIEGRSESFRGSSLLSAFFLCLAAPLVLTSLFGVFATRMNENSLRLFADLGVKGLPRIPPNGIALSALQPEVVTLDSGERVIQLRGELINMTESRFSNVTLEAGLFDESNKTVETVRLPFRNALKSSTEIAALDLETLASLQRAPLPADNGLAPGAREEFRLVLPYEEHAKWIGARPFSVQAAPLP